MATLVRRSVTKLRNKANKATQDDEDASMQQPLDSESQTALLRQYWSQHALQQHYWQLLIQCLTALICCIYATHLVALLTMPQRWTRLERLLIQSWNTKYNRFVLSCALALSACCAAGVMLLYRLQRLNPTMPPDALLATANEDSTNRHKPHTQSKAQQLDEIALRNASLILLALHCLMWLTLLLRSNSLSNLRSQTSSAPLQHVPLLLLIVLPLVLCAIARYARATCQQVELELYQLSALRYSLHSA